MFCNCLNQCNNCNTRWNNCNNCNRWNYPNNCNCNNFRSDCCREREIIFAQTPIIRPITPTPNQQPRNAAYAVGVAGTVADLGIIPLSFGTGTPNSIISVNNNSIIIPAGVYSVSYGATGTLSTATGDGTLSVQLYANGAPIATEIISDSATDITPGNVAKTILYTANGPTALSLRNISGEEITLTGSNITVQHLA